MHTFEDDVRPSFMIFRMLDSANVGSTPTLSPSRLLPRRLRRLPSVDQCRRPKLAPNISFSIISIDMCPSNPKMTGLTAAAQNTLDMVCGARRIIIQTIVITTPPAILCGLPFSVTRPMPPNRTTAELEMRLTPTVPRLEALVPGVNCDHEIGVPLAPDNVTASCWQIEVMRRVGSMAHNGAPKASSSPERAIGDRCRRGMVQRSLSMSMSDAQVRDRLVFGLDARYHRGVGGW